MRILYVYLFKSLISYLLLLIICMAALNLLIGMIGEIEQLKGKYQFFQAFLFRLSSLGDEMTKMFPITMVLGTLVGLGNMINTNEIVIYRVSGIPLFRLCFIVIIPVLVMSLFMIAADQAFFGKMRQAGEATKYQQQKEYKTKLKQSNLWFFSSSGILRIGSVQGDKLKNIDYYRIDNNLPGRLAGYVHAKEGSVKNRTVTLKKGTALQLSPEVQRFSVPDQPVDLKVDRNYLNWISVKPDQLGVWDLYNFRKQLIASDTNNGEVNWQFWNKLFFPLSTAGLVFFSLVFVFGRGRNVSVGNRIFIGTVIGMVYYMIVQIIGPASIVYGITQLVATLVPIAITWIAGFIILLKKG